MSVVEINGIKLEIEEPTIKQIQTFKVGDKVKVLKKSYGDNVEIYVGTIVEFNEFSLEDKVITIAYLDKSYSNCRIRLEHITQETKDIQILKSNDILDILEKDSIINAFEKEIEEKERALQELKEHKELFIKKFKKLFKEEE